MALITLFASALLLPQCFGGAIRDPAMKNLAHFSKYSAYYELDSRPRKMALLIDDMQEEYRAIAMDVVPQIQTLLSAFRAQSLPVFWSFWSRTPSDGISNAMDRFYGPEGIDTRANALYIFDDNGLDILPEIAPETDVEKARVLPSTDLNMFWNFDAEGNSVLEEWLRAAEVDTIVLVGAWTDECILSTATNGFSRSYDVIVVGDAVDTVTAKHRAALDILEGICCKVVDTEEVAQYVLSGAYAETADAAKEEDKAEL